MKIQPFSADLTPAVTAFNARLLKGGADPELVFPETAVPETSREERFLMLDDGSVRGAYILRHQDFWLGTEVISVAHLRLPLSEGIVDRKFAGVGMQLVRHALRQQPLLYALGMGGRQRALPKLLGALHWRVWDVPFYFLVNHPARFLRGIRALRSSAWRRLMLDFAAFSGIGWAATRMWDMARRISPPDTGNADAVTGFSPWADETWENCKQFYSAMALRDSFTLNTLYPHDSGRFHSRMVRRRGEIAGWFVAIDTVMEEHKQFGNLRVGTIVDGLARPEDAAVIIDAATGFLRARGVDLVISNQMHPAWSAGLRGAGFIGAPSNFTLAVSPDLAARCGDGRGIHVNRGDGDGPIHL